MGTDPVWGGRVLTSMSSDWLALRESDGGDWAISSLIIRKASPRSVEERRPVSKEASNNMQDCLGLRLTASTRSLLLCSIGQSKS